MQTIEMNKKYYYKTSHFISIVSMSYRMKRNGPGWASICILCTAVLVMSFIDSVLIFRYRGSFAPQVSSRNIV